jgi:hypothetical protein
VPFVEDMKEVRQLALEWREKAFQAEGTKSVNATRQEDAQSCEEAPGQSGTSGRPDQAR